MTLPLAAIVIAGASAAAQPAVPAPAIEPLAEAMTQPLKRRIVEISSHDGDVTLAAGILAGRYDPEADFRSLCGDLDESERRWSPVCLMLESSDAFRAGDWPRFMSFYEPGAERQRMWDNIELFKQARQRDTQITTLPNALKAWGEYWVLQKYYVTPEGERSPGPAGAGYLPDPGADRLWETNEPASINHPIHRVSTGFEEGQKVLPDAPLNTTAFRLERVGGIRDERRVAAHLLGRDDQIGYTDLILHVREQRFPIHAPPLLEMDPDTLDEAGRALQEAMELKRRYGDGEEIPIDRLVEIWHPGSQEDMRDAYEQAQKTGGQITIRGLDLLDRPLRITSRVMTDHGVVWFAWYSDEDEPDGFSSLAISQLKNEKGEYKLLALPRHAPDNRSRDRQAMNLLGGENGNYSGVPEAITSRHRAELAESEPDDR